MTYTEILQEIAECKDALTTSDYQALKHADGVISDKEYADIKTQRQEWRDRINKLEALIPEAKKQYEADVVKEQEAIRLAEEQARAEEEARMQEEMELAMAKQEEYEADFEAFQNGDMSWDDFSQKYPERISTDEGEDYTDIDIPDSDIILDDSGDDGERGLLNSR